MAKKEDDMDVGFIMRTYYSFLRKYLLRFFLLLFVILVIEATFSVDKFLFKVLIDRGNDFVANSVTKDAFLQILLMLALIYVAILVIRTIGKWLHIHLINTLDAYMIADLKIRFFSHIIRLSHNFHSTHKTGSLISRLIRGGGAIERMTDVIIFNTAPLVFQVIIVAGSLYYFSPVLALISLLTVVAFLWYSFYITDKQYPSNNDANNAEDNEKAFISDIFTNIDSIKYFGKEELITAKFARKAMTTKNKFLRYWGYYRWLDAGQVFIIAAGTFFLVCIPALQLLKNEISLGTLVFIYTVFSNLAPPLFGFAHGIRNFYRAMAEFDVLFQYGKISNDIVDLPRAKELEVTEGKVEFRNVVFGYHKKLFNGFNLKINKNQKVALVGHSGCGKSTLIKLLYRFYDLQGGNIAVDGQDIRKVRQESLRSSFSIVPQECVLFDDTIYNNIAFSNPKATRRQVIKAMEFAQLNQIVSSFPKKENTIVGERGVRLSGGEKQRVSIARAILADKKILVLDEATSALDSRTEHDIQAALHKLMTGRTSIIIAHRLSTIMSADKIVVIHKGNIVQVGTHEQLIKQEGEYRKLWNLQKGGYIK